MERILNIAVLVVLGVMLANALANPKGTKAIFDGIGNLWSTSVNGLLGKAGSSKAGG